VIKLNEKHNEQVRITNYFVLGIRSA